MMKVSRVRGHPHKVQPGSLVDRDQRRSNPAVFRHQDVVGPTCRAGIHQLDPDPGVFQRRPQIRRQRLDRSTTPHEQKLDAWFGRDDGLQMIKRQIGPGTGLKSGNSFGEDQDRPLVPLSRNHETAGTITADDLAAMRHERRDVHRA